MIYLKVRGGLCNRMRALDSFFTLCETTKKDLLVLWPKDKALNSDFESLFYKPKFKVCQFEIINCPPGYPESYLPNLKNSIKNFVKGRKLDKRLKYIAKEIYKIPKEKIMSESFLDDQYNEVIAETQGMVDEMDNMFCRRLRNTTKEFMESESNVYVNSCYRLHEVVDDYAKFIPTKEIWAKIENTTSKFNNTFGLHIRRSDHKASKKYSTLEKFMQVIDNELQINTESTFFLSTDDEPTKEKLIAKYGERIIYNEINSFDRNSPKAVKEAVLDLYCLSKTKKMFGSHHSSFSQVAAKIGGIEEITVK